MVLSEADGADGASAVAPSAPAAGFSSVSEAGGMIGWSPGGIDSSEDTAGPKPPIPSVGSG